MADAPPAQEDQEVKPSVAYIIGWGHGCANHERDESNIPKECLAAYGDGYAYGHERRQYVDRIAVRFDCLEEVNQAAFAMWNIDGRSPHLPSAPPASGCMQHYCWMPVDIRGDNHLCKAHGGKDAPLPKAKK